MATAPSPSTRSLPLQHWRPSQPASRSRRPRRSPRPAILALQGIKSWRPLEPGHTVLINGASGNVGPFAIQIARAYGAEITGVCSTAKVDMVRALGVDDIIDYRKTDYRSSGRRWDRIIDVAARGSILATRRALRPGGAYAWAGGSSASVFQALVLGPVISITGSRKMGLFMWKPFKQEDVAELTRLIEAGQIKPLIDRTYSLEQVPDALRHLDSGAAQGKLVISL